MCTHVLYTECHRFYSKMKQIQTFFPLFGKILCLIHFLKRGPTLTYLPTLSVGYLNGTFKMSAGVHQASHIGAKSNCQFKKLGLAWLFTPWPRSDPFSFKIQIKRDTGHSRISLLFCGWYWQQPITRSHFLQSQGGFYGQKRPFRVRKRDLEGQKRAF